MCDITSKSKHTEPSFLPAMESARGLAAVAVVIFHFTAYPIYTQWRILPVSNAYLGVDFFFVLSGYIIAKNYINRLCTLRDIRTFCLLRLARIWPLHLFYLLCFMILAQSRSVQWSAPDVLIQIAMVHSTPFAGDSHQFNPPSWSISAEWLCYIIFAAVVYLTGERWQRIVCLLLFAISAMIVNQLINAGLNDLTFGNGAPRGLCGFFVGVIIFLFARRWRAPYAGWLGIILLGWVFFVKRPNDYWDIVAPLIFAPVVLWLGSESAQSSWLSRPALVRIGTFSYSIYLGHMLQYAFVMKALSLLWPSGAPFAVALPCALSFIYFTSSFTYKYIEAPARNILRKSISMLAQTSTAHKV